MMRKLIVRSAQGMTGQGAPLYCTYLPSVDVHVHDAEMWCGTCSYCESIDQWIVYMYLTVLCYVKFYCRILSI